MSRAFNALIAILSISVSLTSACRCVRPQLQTTYFNPYYSRIVAAKLTLVFKTEDANYFVFRVRKVYKGCKLSFFIAKSSTSSASCGVSLTKNKTYIVPLGGKGLFSINSCQVCLTNDTTTLAIARPAFVRSHKTDSVLTPPPYYLTSAFLLST